MSTIRVTATPVTARDVAMKAGVSLGTARSCLNSKKAVKYSQSTVSKVMQAAQEIGYNAQTALKYGRGRRSPANSVFASREAETTAMQQLRKSGHTDAEISHRCGVCYQTVVNRIGTQPAELTKASQKLAGKVRSAKAGIKRAYVQQQCIQEYNALAAQLNEHMLEAQKLQASIECMQKKANAASKATKIPLLRLITGTKAS